MAKSWRMGAAVPTAAAIRCPFIRRGRGAVLDQSPKTFAPGAKSVRRASMRQNGGLGVLGVGPVAVQELAQVVALGLQAVEGRGVAVAVEVAGGGLDGALQALQLHQQVEGLAPEVA